MKTNYEKVFSKESLIETAQEMQHSKFKPGFDNMTAQNAETWIEINYDNLLMQIKQGKYKPQPLIGFSVSKQNGSFRQLVKPCALDMIIQKAILSYLQELVSPLLSVHIHAFLPGRGVTTAVKEYCEHGSKYKYALKIDPSDFFNSIDHSILFESLKSLKLSQNIIDLITRFISAPVIEDGKVIKRNCGIHQGIPIAPVLANLYLLPLDGFMEERNCIFIRYADDIVLFGNDYQEMQLLYHSIKELMENKLMLRLNKDKCTVDVPERISFLGYGFEKNSNGLVSIDSPVPSPSINRQWISSSPKANNRHLSVISNGILSKKDFAFRFESDNRKYDFPPIGCNSINVYSDVMLDSNFLAQAAKHRIIVNFFNDRNKKIGSFIPQTRPLSPPVTLTQLEYYNDKMKRLHLASRFVLGSIHNLRLNIRYYRKNYDNLLFTESLLAIDTLEKAVKACTDYEELLMLEARVRKAYYHCFDAFIRMEDFLFDKRTRRPPKNEVNSMLSFGYTVLYNLIATEIEKSALDVRIGYLHATNNRKESLNLDIAELFKPLIVDRVVFSMINRGMIDKEKHFVHLENGTVYLNYEGKHLFLRAFYDKMDTRITVGQRTESYYNIIKQEISKLVMFFRKKDTKYIPFKQVR